MHHPPSPSHAVEVVAALKVITYAVLANKFFYRNLMFIIVSNNIFWYIDSKVSYLCFNFFFPPVFP